MQVNSNGRCTAVLVYYVFGSVCVRKAGVGSSRAKFPIISVYGKQQDRSSQVCFQKQSGIKCRIHLTISIWKSSTVAITSLCSMAVVKRKHLRCPTNGRLPTPRDLCVVSREANGNSENPITPLRCFSGPFFPISVVFTPSSFGMRVILCHFRTGVRDRK